MIGSLLAHFPLQTVVTGAVTGVTYGVMAAGIVLIYRSSKVINFAMAEMGGFGAAVLSRMVINWHVNYWVSFVACVLIGAAVGAAIELTVVRRLFSAPRVVLMIATIGVAELLLYFQGILPIPTMVTGYPTPIASSWQIGSVVIQGQEILVLVVVGVLYAALWLFLGHTKYGLAIGASAANPNAARLAGINVRLTSTLVWTVAGTLTTIATILSAPLVTTTSTDTFSLGPTLLIRALAAALIARMVSIPIALVSGVAIGVGEALIYFNWPNQQGLLDLVLLGVILLTLIPLARKGVLSGAQSGWSFAPRVRPLPGVLHDWWVARRLPQMAVGVAIVAAVLLPFVLGEPSQQFLFSQVFIYAIAALSVTMLTGWAGQLSLGQFALVGLGGDEHGRTERQRPVSRRRRSRRHHRGGHSRAHRRHVASDPRAPLEHHDLCLRRGSLELAPRAVVVHGGCAHDLHKSSKHRADFARLGTGVLLLCARLLHHLRGHRLTPSQE